MRSFQISNHALLSDVHSIVREYLLRAESPSEPPAWVTPAEEYAIEVLSGASAIVECLEQLHFSIDLMSGYRKATAPVGMSRHAYIVFALENFHLRSTSVFDRSLRLTNTVFDLGLPERQCREQTVIKNLHVRGTPVRPALQALSAATAPLRRTRNLIAHASSYSEQELSLLGGHMLVLDGLEVDDPMLRFSHLVKTKADAFIADKKNELRPVAAKFDEATKDFFEVLRPHFEAYVQSHR